MEDFSLPAFEFTPEDIANIRANLGLPEDEVTTPVEPVQEQPRRRRGRPPKKPVVIEGEITEPSTVSNIIGAAQQALPPAPLTKRDERDVANRLAAMMVGGTGLVAIPTKDYVRMTDEEAQAIAEPLASYLVRNADTVPVARQILDNYDLLAVGLGTASYLTRVYNDRRNERDSNPAKSAVRVSASETGNDGQQSNEGVSNPFSAPSSTGSFRANPSDI